MKASPTKSNTPNEMSYTLTAGSGTNVYNGRKKAGDDTVKMINMTTIPAIKAGLIRLTYSGISIQMTSTSPAKTIKDAHSKPTTSIATPMVVRPQSAPESKVAMAPV